MSHSTAEAGTCPACDADQLEYWEPLETTICQACSYVVNEGGATTAPDIPVEESSEETEKRDWSQAIAVSDKSEENLVDVLERVEYVMDEFGVTDELGVRAGEIVVEAWKCNFMHGRTKADTVGASVYAASREGDSTIPPALIARHADTDCEDLKSTYQKLRSNLDLDFGPPVPEDYVFHICTALDLPVEVAGTAKAILQRHRSTGNPVGVGSAGVYEAANGYGEDVTLRQVARVIGFAKETVWRQTSNIRSSLEQE